MKILVIKQTSLGDVLHSTGHVRALKQFWPDTELTLLTAASSLDIYRNNPHVDRIITVDRYRVKQQWRREPGWAFNHMREVMGEVREQQFDLAFDLQGLAKSVVFLYGARANKKFVKGHWPALHGFKDSSLHAIREMDGVLNLAGVSGINTDMEFATSAQSKRRIDALIKTIGQENKPLVILSPYSRWRSKDWSLQKFIEVAASVRDRFRVVFTGAPDRADEIDDALSRKFNHDVVDHDSINNLAGKINLVEFAELVRRANLMVTGDSFPMHVASAVDTPVIALFGPTDEKRVGPLGNNSRVIRVPDCQRCDRANCPKQCLTRLALQPVLDEIAKLSAGNLP